MNKRTSSLVGFVVDILDGDCMCSVNFDTFLRCYSKSDVNFAKKLNCLVLDLL